MLIRIDLRRVGRGLSPPSLHLHRLDLSPLLLSKVRYRLQLVNLRLEGIQLFPEITLILHSLLVALL